MDGRQRPKANRVQRAMSLRGSDDDRLREPFTFRCPPELLRYIEEAAKSPKRTKTEVITSALELERDLGRRLRGEEAFLAEFAASNELSLGRDLPEVLALLVLKGIEAMKRDRKR